MNDAKPWVTAELVDTERRVTEAGSYFHVDFDLTLATCCQRDELVEVVRELVEALDMAAHSEECSRTEECDELEPGEECGNHERACPSCDCGVDRWQASATKARGVLAKWSGK